MSAFSRGKIIVSCFLSYRNGTPFITIKGDFLMISFSNACWMDSDTKYWFCFLSFKRKVCGFEHPATMVQESSNKNRFMR